MTKIRSISYFRVLRIDKVCGPDAQNFLTSFLSYSVLPKNCVLEASSAIMKRALITLFQSKNACILFHSLTIVFRYRMVLLAWIKFLVFASKSFVNRNSQLIKCRLEWKKLKLRISEMFSWGSVILQLYTLIWSSFSVHNLTWDNFCL